MPPGWSSDRDLDRRCGGSGGGGAFIGDGLRDDAKDDATMASARASLLITDGSSVCPLSFRESGVRLDSALGSDMEGENTEAELTDSVR
jgi:hypothetical protein